MKIKEKLPFIGLIFYYLIVGVLTIVIALTNASYSKELCGILLILSSIVHLLLYVINKGYNKLDKSFFLMLFLVAFALGFVFIFAEEINMVTICYIWGILDIFRASCEIKGVLPEVKENKLELIEVLVALGDIVFGILLCLHLEHGIKDHLIYMGSAFIITAAKYIVDEFVVKKLEAEKE